MHFASQDQTQSLTWELWEEEDAGGWAGFFCFFFPVGVLLFCFGAKTRWILRLFPLRLKRVKDKHRFWVRSVSAQNEPELFPETRVPPSGPAGSDGGPV